MPKLWQRLIYIAGGVGAIAAAVAALPKATEVVEPYGPAHRGFVRETTAEKIDPIRQTTDVLLYWKLEDQKNRAKQEEGSWNVQLQREHDPGARALIQQQIERATSDQKRIDGQLQKLKAPDFLK
jgi:hypothetical protein